MVIAAPVAAKIGAPVHRPGLVRRARLIGRLADTWARPLVLLVAPPGYGKTTVLAQWVEGDGRRAAWVTADEADNDPARILGHIWVALQDPALSGSDSLAPLPAGRLTVSRLVEEIRRHSTPTMVVLDDIHLLHRSPVPDLLVEFATLLPPGSQLAVASRSLPSLKLGRLRAEDRCAEFGPADLAFDVSEAAEVLSAAGVETGAVNLGGLVERTEGWPAGVYLSAVALRDRVDLPGVPGEVSAGNAYIADFLGDELLAGQSPETVRFLLRTAVLPQFSAALCDAVLETSGSASRLAEIERRNLFLVPLDYRREWYRYHRLFAEALVAELRRREPGEELRVRRRAASWYEEQGQVEESIKHWIAADEPIPAARLVARYGQMFMTAGRIATVLSWLEALGPDAVAGYPPLAVGAAMVWAQAGNAARAQSLLLAAERTEFFEPMPDGHTSLASAVAALRASMGSQGIDRMLVDARLAVQLEPPGSPWYPMATAMLGTAQLLSGHSGEGVKQLEQSALMGRQVARLAAQLSLAEMSLLAADRHDDTAAERYAASAYEVMVEANLQEAMPSALTYLVAAKAQLRAGRRTEASHQLGTAVRLYLRLPPTSFPWYAVQVALVLGEVSLELDDVAAARARIKDARRHLARLVTEGNLRDRLDALSAAVARAGASHSTISAMALSAAEERVLRLLPTHLSLGEIGDELHVSRNTVKTHVAAVYQKLHATTRTEAVSRARELRLLSA